MWISGEAELRNGNPLILESVIPWILESGNPLVRKSVIIATTAVTLYLTAVVLFFVVLVGVI